MSTNRRKSPRQTITRPALIQFDTGPIRMQRCTVHDMSETGSQIGLLEPDALPPEFTLILSYGGGVQRRCRLAWQNGNRAGVRFTPR
jgi:hypothetical protein